jgi:uncharacterized protein
MKMITDTVKEYVSIACQADTNAFGSSYFEQHILVVVSYAKQLAKIYKADAEAVELAAYLHDIAAIKDFKTLLTHAADSSVIASEFLSRNNYPADKTAKVKQAILTHSTPLNLSNASCEEVCISNADAVSQIIKTPFWFFYIFSVRKFNYEEGYKWYKARVDSHWAAMTQEAKGLIKDEYLSVSAMLKTNAAEK